MRNIGTENKLTNFTVYTLVILVMTYILFSIYYVGLQFMANERWFIFLSGE